MYWIISDDLIEILKERCAAATSRFAPRFDIRPGFRGGEILGAVYLDVAKLANNDPSILADSSMFRKVVDKRARCECLKLLRDSPWGDSRSDTSNLEDD